MTEANLARRTATLLLIIFLSSGLGAGKRWSSQQQLSGYPWAFLRGGQPLQANETLVALAAVGDTSLGRGVNFRQALGGSASWLRAADLAMVNLECAISAESETGSNSLVTDFPLAPIRLAAPPAAADSLAKAGIDLAGIANNHTADGGGPVETALHLAQAGVTAVGGDQPALRLVKGIRLAFLAFNAVAIPGDKHTPETAAMQWNRETGLAAVRRARLAADVVVVSMHWGYEYDTTADPRQVEAARALLAAGADLVIGHHPHVAQSVLVWQREDDGGQAAALSLGNFAFDQGQGQTGRGLALRAFFDRQGLRALQLIPVWAGPRPRLAPPGGRLPEVIQTAPVWETIRFACQGETCRETGAPGEYEPILSGAGIFQSGMVDLTGDRTAEIVRLSNGRVRVYEGERLSWESPPEWRVLDLATGDPDQDGRDDLVLAMEKPDQDGVWQSHPFIIGYRGGLYRTVWGGSPVRDPLREVALGDVNGDSEPELVVLEEARDGSGRALTIWRWHGWGFSLLWRSEYGNWQDVEAIEGGIAARRVK